jgi:hypothetical protein
MNHSPLPYSGVLRRSERHQFDSNLMDRDPYHLDPRLADELAELAELADHQEQLDAPDQLQDPLPGIPEDLVDNGDLFADFPGLAPEPEPQFLFGPPGPDEQAVLDKEQEEMNQRAIAEEEIARSLEQQRQEEYLANLPESAAGGLRPVPLVRQQAGIFSL